MASNRTKSGSVSLSVDEIKEIEMDHKNDFDGPSSPLSENSMMITLLPNMNEESRDSISREGRPDSLGMQVQEYFQTDKKICIDPVCFQGRREVTSLEEHRKHKQVSYHELLKDLKILKNNEFFKVSHPERYKGVMKNLEDIVREIQNFELEFLQTMKTLKMKTIKHITSVKKSFESDHYDKVRQRVKNNFSYPTVIYALGEIQEFKKFRYDNLDYPHFKSNMVLQRITEINFNHKVLCLQQLKQWIRYLQGDNPNSNKIYSRSTSSFLFKSPSEKNIFSYYLKNLDYLVLDCGKRFQRIGLNSSLPLCMVQKELDQNGIRFKINKKVKSITIGCGILRQIQQKRFDNCFDSGLFLNSKGILFSDKGESENIFTFSQGDIISLHRRNNKIEFFKKVGNQWKGFSRRLNALKREEKYYPGIFLKDKESQVQILN